MANGTQQVVKISGYLEKKAKLRIGSPWKKYWFVLEGRLLLYYRSKDEYEAISPCKGSINLCPPCNIKPALSAACVFQIECRANTVTLRAESRSEQERWMQALLAAIAQSKTSPNRMSHFRYSLDDLPVPTKDTKKSESTLSRQNTMPHRISSLPKKGTKDIIERLQQMGAQTYGGSLGTITKLANKEQTSNESSPKCSERHSDSSTDVTYIQDDSASNTENANVTPENRSLKPAQSVERIQNINQEKEQYSIIQEENSIEVFLDQQLAAELAKEKNNTLIVDNDQYIGQIDVDLNDEKDKRKQTKKLTSLIRKTSFFVENDQYCHSKDKNDEETYIRNKEIRKSEHLYERISSDSSTSECLKNTSSEDSYKRKLNTTNLYERISCSSSNSDSQIKLNHEYSAVIKDKQTENKSLNVKDSEDVKRLSDHEYTLPINTDYNKNSLIVDNDQYIPTADDKSHENPYSNGLIFTAEYAEYDAIDKIKEMEGLYEDPDRLKKHESVLYNEVEPTLPPRPDSKKQESSEETASQTSSNDGKLKRKNNRFSRLTQLIKSEKKVDSNGDVYKSKPKKRSTSFIKKVLRRKTKSLDSEEDITYETVDYECVEKQEKKDKNDIQMLQELQKILESRKNLLQEKLNATDQTKSAGLESQAQPIVEEQEEEPVEIRSEEALDEERPSLPPRQSSLSLSPCHDVPQNNKTILETAEIAVDKSTDNIIEEIKSNTNVKSIDEILEDLDNEKNIQESRQKVKQLIDKFNDFQCEDDVILRKKSKFNAFEPQLDFAITQNFNLDGNEIVTRESDELSKLLDELSKVTCAPVLTPGVTSSLVTPILTDDEWLKLIPIRRRRLSEPDYDVPRPHRSLQLHDRNKQVADNPIPATRFFGPVLPPTIDNNMMQIDTSLYTSMDPDSLELLPSTTMESQKRLSQTNSISSNTEKDHTSYTSHGYIKSEEIIYAHPKHVLLNSKPETKDQIIYSNFNSINQQKKDTNLKDGINNVEVNIRSIEISENLKPLMIKSEEMFIDSLEPLAEISTAF